MVLVAVGAVLVAAVVVVVVVIIVLVVIVVVAAVVAVVAAVVAAAGAGVIPAETFLESAACVVSCLMVLSLLQRSCVLMSTGFWLLAYVSYSS